MISRRQILTLPSLVATPWIGGCATAASTTPAPSSDDRITHALAALERRHGGRLGVAMLDTGSGHAAAHRGGERFALCSTFKALAAACVLARVDRGEDTLSRRVAFGPDDLVTYSPVTEKHARAGGLSMGEVCEAAVTLSDNTAGNLMLDSFGGPAGFTAFMRSLGDTETRLDRRETALNIVPPGELRDTTTPRAMLGSLRAALLGTALSPASRAQLAEWLVATKTGDRRLRAAAPPGWRAGDKTGTNGDLVNDVAIFWPPGRAPILVAAYSAETRATPAERDTLIADVGRLAVTL